MGDLAHYRCLSGLILLLLVSILSTAHAQKLPADLNEARTLGNSAAEQFRAGRIRDAAQLARRALALYEGELPAEHPEVLQSLYDLGYYLQALGQLAEAEPYFLRSLEAREKASPPRPLDLAQSLSGLGVLRQVQGRLIDAEPLYKRALEIREKSLPPGHAQIATSLNNLAYLYQLLGRSTEAEPLHKRSLAIWEKALPQGHPNLAWSLVNLGILYLEQGRLDEAEPLHRRALEIREKALPAGHPDIAKSLASIGTIQQRRRKLQDAEASYRRALTILEKALPANHPDIAIAINNLAIVYDAQGRLAEADAAYKRALDIREKSLPPSHPEISANLNNLGIVQRRQGLLSDAEQVLKRALELRERSLPAGHPDIARTVSNLSVLEMARQSWRAALAYELRVTDMVMARERREREGIPGVTDRTTGSGSADLRTSSQDFYGLVKVAHRVVAAEPGRRSELLETTFSRAQWASNSEAAASLAQMAARNAKNDPRLARLIRHRQDLVAEWNVRDKALLASASLPPERRNSENDNGLRQRIASIDHELEAIDRALRSEFAEYAALATPESLSVGEAQRLLRENEALVFILDTEYMAAELPEETFVWVVTKTSARWTRSGVGGKALRESVFALRCGLDASLWQADDTSKRCRGLTNTAPRGAMLPFDLSRAHALYTALFAQTEDLIRDKHIVIVPSGPLAALPFQVLTTQATGNAIPDDAEGYAGASWLSKRHAITTLPSVSSLRALRHFAKASKANKPFIGFGNPLLHGPDGSNRTAWERQQCESAPSLASVAMRDKRGSLPGYIRGGLADVGELRKQMPLPETAGELCAVAKSFGAAQGDVHLGSRATEIKIKFLSRDGGLADRKVVHFATHGLLAGETAHLTRSRAEPALMLTPPTRATEDDDGLLTASEIAQLRMDADWVILSACNTAAAHSDAADAETLSGLARAFFYAGARSLLVSHWAVDSDATVELITATIAGLAANPGLERSEALRRSMVSMIGGGARAHPAFWSPFAIVGEGGR